MFKQKATLSPTKEPTVDYRKGETPARKNSAFGGQGEASKLERAAGGPHTHSNGQGSAAVNVRGHKSAFAAHRKTHPAAR
jgi:hypothetical protein